MDPQPAASPRYRMTTEHLHRDPPTLQGPADALVLPHGTRKLLADLPVVNGRQDRQLGLVACSDGERLVNQASLPGATTAEAAEHRAAAGAGRAARDPGDPGDPGAVVFRHLGGDRREALGAVVKFRLVFLGAGVRASEEALLAKPTSRMHLTVPRRGQARLPRRHTGRCPAVALAGHARRHVEVPAHDEDQLLNNLPVLNDDVAWQALHQHEGAGDLGDERKLAVLEEGETKDDVFQELHVELALEGRREPGEDLRIEHLLLHAEPVAKISLDLPAQLLRDTAARHEAADLRHIRLDLIVEDIGRVVRDDL
mmetsp:Transcript_139336/g.445562  ORF Transcript_139336/g.445562 Transcript_139336/m.445562 type:complete len:312 (+) Transcript_139336:307-1242(+)